MKVAITGSSGFLGTELCRSLESDGIEVVRIRRGPDSPVRWDPEAGLIDSASLEGADIVVHLAGEALANRRWTKRQKEKILSSRIKGTNLLSETIAGLDHKPTALLSASGIGFYGNRPNEVLTEASGAGQGFLVDVCQAWEQGTGVASEAGIRVCHLRTSLVLGAHGGLLAKLLPLYRLGLGGRLGHGRQMMSWISLEDQIGAIRWLMSSGLAGPVNMTSPNSVANRRFNSSLAQSLGKRAIFIVPRVAARVLLGTGAADELAFSDSHVVPERLLDDGYTFIHPQIEDAFGAIVTSLKDG